jgi:predicted hydrocarbon binding protein
LVQEDQKIVGKNLLHIRDFIKHKWGSEGLEIFQSRSKIDFESIFEDKFYPFKDYVNALENVKNIFNDEKAAYNIGAHRAKHLLLTKGQMMKELQMLKKVTNAWDKFNSFGDIELKEIGERKYSVTLSNYDSHPAYCERTRGFFAGLIRCVLTEGCTVKEVKCVRDGHEHCEFVIDIKK